MALLLVNAPPDHNLEKRVALDYKFCALLEHNMSEDELVTMDRKAVSNTLLQALSVYVSLFSSLLKRCTDSEHSNLLMTLGTGCEQW